jgi:cell division protein FtsL
MTGLETTFYIMAIIFMSLMFLLMIALAVAVFAIRAKIQEIERNVTDMLANKLGIITSLLTVGEKFATMAKKLVERARP